MIINASVSAVLFTGWIRRARRQHRAAQKGRLSKQESSQVVVTGIKAPVITVVTGTWPHAFHCSPQTVSPQRTLPASCLICAPLKMPFCSSTSDPL